MHLNTVNFLPPAFHGKGCTVLTGSCVLLRMSGGCSQVKVAAPVSTCTSAGRGGCGDRHNPPYPGLWLRQVHGKALPSGHSHKDQDTQSPMGSSWLVSWGRLQRKTGTVEVHCHLALTTRTVLATVWLPCVVSQLPPPPSPSLSPPTRYCCRLRDYYTVSIPSTERPDGQGHVWFILPSWP